jgi:glycosyltransferase involved in cell wall biosynthesis
MHILFVSTHGGGFGGSEYLWSLTAKEALEHNHKVSIALNSALCHYPGIQELKNNGAVIFAQKPFSTSGFIGKLKFKFNKKYPSLINRYRGVDFANIDAICISQAGTYDICYQDELVMKIRKHKIPFYLISQYHDEHGTLEQWKYNKARTIFPLAKKFYFVSERNRQLCELLIAKQITNAAVINNPFRYDTKTPTSYPNVKGTINFACVARLDAGVKCQNILIKILSNRKWEERDWHLNLYGAGKDKDYLTDLVKHVNLEHRVTLHGHIGHINKIWELNHLLLLPSIGEGIPLSLIEAFGFGRPAVVTDVGGNDLLVEDGVTGFLAKSFSEKNFGEALENMWAFKERWSHMGANAFKILHEQFDTSPQKKVLEDIMKND